MFFTYDEEAVIQDADIWMADQTRQFKLRRKAEKELGICFHDGWMGLPDSGKIFYPEQELLTGDQQICTDICKQIFETEEELMEDRKEKYLKYTGSY